MSLFKKLYDRAFFRFLMYVFRLDSLVWRPRRDFTPYFQYKIGSYVSDYYLYFLKPPYFNVYMVELTRKFFGYSGHDLACFLDFHYRLFEDKAEFLRFLRYEMTSRLKWRSPKKKFSRYWDVLESCHEWVIEQEKLLFAAAPTETALNALIDARFTSQLEPAFSEITRSHYGAITLFNELHLSRLIQVFILLKELTAPGKRPQLLFKQFSNTDLAAILRNFPEFRDKQVNTIQKAIGKCNDELRPDDPVTAKLIAALTDFFYKAS